MNSSEIFTRTFGRARACWRAASAPATRTVLGLFFVGMISLPRFSSSMRMRSRAIFSGVSGGLRPTGGTSHHPVEHDDILFDGLQQRVGPIRDQRPAVRSLERIVVMQEGKRRDGSLGRVREVGGE